jgi:predicted nucleic acid-binding protein
MTGVIIDASATLAWLFEEGTHAERFDSMLGKLRLVAPSLWRLEVTNAVLVKERRQQITPQQGARYLKILEALEVEYVPLSIAVGMEPLAQLARAHQLSSYDAVYLDLALVRGLPLWTLDKNLRQAAQRAGVELA